MYNDLIDHFILTNITQMVKKMFIDFTYQLSLKSEPRAPISCAVKGLK